MRSLFLLLTAILSFQACVPLNTPGTSGNRIFVINFAFTPVIDSGTPDRTDSLPVTFVWADSNSGIGHTIVWDSGPAAAIPGNIGVTYTGTQTVILTPGTYRYHCSLHAEYGMAGVIVVVPFDTPTASRKARRAEPDEVFVTPPSPAVVPENPREAARRSQPATS